MTKAKRLLLPTFMGSRFSVSSDTKPKMGWQAIDTETGKVVFIGTLEEVQGRVMQLLDIEAGEVERIMVAAYKAKKEAEDRYRIIRSTNKYNEFDGFMLKDQTKHTKFEMFNGRYDKMDESLAREQVEKARMARIKSLVTRAVSNTILVIENEKDDILFGLTPLKTAKSFDSSKKIGVDSEGRDIRRFAHYEYAVRHDSVGEWPDRTKFYIQYGWLFGEPSTDILLSFGEKEVYVALYIVTVQGIEKTLHRRYRFDGSRIDGKRSKSVLPRDSQRQKVYTSEVVAGIKSLKFKDIEETQRYVDKIVNSRWWKSHSTVTFVTVKAGSGSFKGAHARRIAERDQNGNFIRIGGVITTSPRMQNEQIMLHELAHILAVIPFLEESAHGREFVRTYIALVNRFKGKEDANKLRASFRKFKVKWYKKRT